MIYSTSQNTNSINKENKEKKAMTFMRENIRELNRSMESIEKMIQKSRRLISHSRDASVNGYSLEKSKENKKERLPLEPSVKNQETYQPSSNKNERNSTIYRQINLKQTNIDHSDKKLNSLNRLVQESRKEEANSQKFRQTINSKSKEKARLESPYKQVYEQGKALYKFSPQKTNNMQFNQNKSAEKNPLVATNIKIKPKPNPNRPEPMKDQRLKIDLSFLSKNTNPKENILIQDEQSIPNEFNQYNSPDQTKNNSHIKQKEYRFKTQYKPQQSNDIYNMYKLEEPSSNTEVKPQKRKINLKLFQSQAKKSCLVSQRSKKSTFESIKLSTRKNLVKELQELETQSSSNQQRKAKFILKIKKYGFVEKYLSQEQIWNIYEQLIESNIPELKWPIVIVDEVYHRMKMYK